MIPTRNYKFHTQHTFYRRVVMIIHGWNARQSFIFMLLLVRNCKKSFSDSEKKILKKWSVFTFFLEIWLTQTS